MKMYFQSYSLTWPAQVVSYNVSQINCSEFEMIFAVYRIVLVVIQGANNKKMFE